MKIEQQKKHDIIEDLKLLSEQYGWTIDESFNIIGFKPKTTDDLLLERGKELYPKGTMFIPVGKNKPRISNGKVELLCDRLFCWNDQKMFLVYDSGEWAEVIN